MADPCVNVCRMAEAIFDLAYYRARISALAERGIFLGTSSWKYDGWVGQIYTAERYEYRGRFAMSRFEENCLREYAETFRTVCFDGSFYALPDERKLQAMADQVPDNFRFGFKVSDEITVKRWPEVARSGQRGGTLNENFLNAPLFVDRFLGPLQSIRAKVGPIIFEISKLYPAEFSSTADFLAELDRFFSAIPKDGWLYSVELRNKKWLGPEYLACLRKHGVAHVWNNWTDMPPVSEQFGIVGEPPTEHLEVARFLLKPGRKYEEAVAKFKPYKITQEINEDARAALQRLIDKHWVRLSRDGVYAYINNRLEGNALNTVLAVLDRIEALKAVPRPAPTAIPPKPPKPAQTQFDLGL
jgi:uncharacterized protein YecE (DUF72 family)